MSASDDCNPALPALGDLVFSEGRIASCQCVLSDDSRRITLQGIATNSMQNLLIAGKKNDSPEEKEIRLL